VCVCVCHLQARGKYEAERASLKTEITSAAAATEAVRKEAARVDAELKDYKARAQVCVCV
jgi:phage shock protein A